MLLITNPTVNINKEVFAMNLKAGGGGVTTLDVRYCTDPAWPGVVRVTITGLVLDSALLQFWAALNTPLGAAALVSVFDFRRAVVAYRRPPRLIPGAPQQKPGAFLCGPDQYELLMHRASQLSDLGVRRAVFCSESLALEWALEEATRIDRQERGKSTASLHQPSVPASPCL